MVMTASSLIGSSRGPDGSGRCAVLRVARGREGIAGRRGGCSGACAAGRGGSGRRPGGRLSAAAQRGDTDPTSRRERLSGLSVVGGQDAQGQTTRRDLVSG